MKHGGFQLVIHGDPWREPLRNEASRSGKVFVFGFAGGGGVKSQKIGRGYFKGIILRRSLKFLWGR